jgi:hypothetical protein
MNTATEIQARIAEREPSFANLQATVEREIVDPLVGKLSLVAYGREVCARRARKLRKRGDMIRFHRWTATGKCRYIWVPGARWEVFL